MAIERKWPAVTAKSFIANGTSTGIVTIADARGFYTKQSIQLISNAHAPVQFQVQEVLSPTQLVVGPIGPKVGRQNFSDISMFLVSDNPNISASEQYKNNIPDKDHYSAVYESDPIIADRVIGVDQNGEFYSDKNPLPTTTKMERIRQITPDSFDDVIIVRDADEYPTKYLFLLNDVHVGGIDVTYDDAKAAVRYKRNDNE